MQFDLPITTQANRKIKRYKIGKQTEGFTFPIEIIFKNKKAKTHVSAF